ncbi:MAG: hypothetical protein EBX41_01290 [Chitinophagia bacterium]|nr:hypothetical protein [Chitinophagia bacterium]
MPMCALMPLAAATAMCYTAPKTLLGWKGAYFTRGMVRGLVATQLYIAKNKLPPAHLHAIFEAKDSKKARFDVPGYGLYLEHIAYPQGYMQDVNTLQ